MTTKVMKQMKLAAAGLEKCVKTSRRAQFLSEIEHGRPARTLVSLFTGAGGLDSGLEAAGFSVSICVEIEKDARGTLTANRPSSLSGFRCDMI